MANPLLSTNSTTKARQIELQMQQFKMKIKSLEDQYKIIGTDKDNHKFRQMVEVQLKEATVIMKNCQTSTVDF